MRNILLFPLVFCIASSAACASDLSGNWRGTWTKDGDALPVTATFAKSGDAYSGSFSSDALQVMDIPFAEASDVNGKVHLTLKGDQTTTIFDGTESGDKIAGTFSDGGSSGTFELVRASLPSSAISARDVAFRNGDVTLAGTLLLPAGAGKHPAILFLQGSGPEGRFANHWLAEKFAEAGFVALIFDKRGVGQSTGDWQKAGFDALADDAVAGIRFLRAQTDVDPAHVGIYGHSQGGTIAPLVASKASNLGFVIASAAGGIAPADVETYSVENSIGLSQLPPGEQADARSYVQALVDVAYRRKYPETLQTLSARFKGRSWYFDPPPSGDSYWTISSQIASFDPAKWWRRVKAPVLLVYGAKDERIPVDASVNAIEAALKSGGNAHVTLHTYADANHTFTITGAAKGWPKHEPDYADVLTRWAGSIR